MKAELKIFIAGSKELSKPRTLIRNVASNLSTDYDRKGKSVSINVYSFENFSLTFADNGQQNNYNRFLRNEADLAIFVFEDKTGGITMDEFDVAYSSYARRKHPQICILSKKSQHRNEKLDMLRNKVSGLNQYYNEYEDDAELQRLVEFLLRDCVDAKLAKASRKSTIGIISMICAVALAIVLAVLLPEGQDGTMPESRPEETAVPAAVPAASPAPEQTVTQDPAPAPKQIQQQTAGPKPLRKPAEDRPDLKSLADSGDAASCYRLATDYQNGVNGVAKDLNAAYIYMKKAAESGYADAYRPLAEMYHGGRGVAKDRASAEYWYRQAAANGDKRAQQILNNM